MKFYQYLSYTRFLASAALGLAGSLLAPVSLASLDLSPQQETFDLDGMKMSQLAFNTGGKARATYQPPFAWKCSGGRDYLELHPDGMAQVKARVSKSPASPEVTFDAAGCKRLTEKVITSLPEGSDQIEVLAEELNPLQIDGKRTFLVELSYVYYGERFACYSLFLDRVPEMLTFRLNCRESNYQALRAEFHRSLYSWQNL